MGQNISIQHIAIEKITRDEAQPRTYFDEQALQELAQSIKTEGVINAIEIDASFKIITGERRWRAAKLAGLTTIPAKVRDMYPRERFRRQLIENIHTGTHGSMVALDIANALKKIIDGDVERGGERKAVIVQLAKELGKRTNWIYTLLDLLEEKGEVKTYLERPGAKYTFIREANSIQDVSLRNKIKEKIVKGDIRTRDTVRELASALKRSPAQTERLLAQDYKEKNATANLMKIYKIAPVMETNLDSVTQGITVATNLQQLLLSLKKLEIEKITKYDRTQIKKLIEILVPISTTIHARIDQVEQKQLTEKKDGIKLEGKTDSV